MKELEYPFDGALIIKKKKSLKRRLLEEGKNFTPLRIAILGGQTTNDIKNVLEVFLLNYGIKGDFYESEYNMFYEDGMFENPELKNFAPEIIYLCTCIRNIPLFPAISDSSEEAASKLSEVYRRFEGLWEHLSET